MWVLPGHVAVCAGGDGPFSRWVFGVAVGAGDGLGVGCAPVGHGLDDVFVAGGAEGGSDRS